MKMTKVNDMQKQVCVSYDSMEELLNRKKHIRNTLEGYLARFNNEQYISDTVISISDKKYHITFILDLTEAE